MNINTQWLKYKKSNLKSNLDWLIEHVLKSTILCEYNTKRALLDIAFESSYVPARNRYKKENAKLSDNYHSAHSCLSSNDHDKRAPIDADFKSNQALLDESYMTEVAPMFENYDAACIELQVETLVENYSLRNTL